MRIHLILIALLASCLHLHAQIRPGRAVETSWSLAITAIHRTSVKLGQLTNGSIKADPLPGGSFQGEFELQLRNGITGRVGMGLQVIPASLKFDLDRSKYSPGGMDWVFKDNVSTFGRPLVYFPVALGYSFHNAGRWRPSIAAGVNLTLQTSYSISSSSHYLDASNAQKQVYRFVVTSPHNARMQLNKVLVANARVTHANANRSVYYLGAVACFPSDYLYTGSFTATYENDNQTASYVDKGNFVGLQFGYILRNTK